MPERQALVVAENGKPILAALKRCIDGRTSARLLQQQKDARATVADARQRQVAAEVRATAAVVEAERRGLAEWW